MTPSNVFLLTTPKGELVTPVQQGVFLRTAYTALKNAIGNHSSVLTNTEKDTLNMCVSLLDTFEHDLIYFWDQSDLKQDTCLLATVDIVKFTQHLNKDKLPKVSAKEDFQFDTVLTLLKHKRLISKVLQLDNYSGVSFLEEIKQSSLVKTQQIVKDSFVREHELDNQHNIAFVIYQERKNQSYYMTKKGSFSGLQEACLFQSMAAAKRSAVAHKRKDYSVLEVELKVRSLVFDQSTENAQLNSILAKTSKENLLAELEKDDIEALRKRLSELEEQYPETQTSERRQTKRKM